MKLVTILMVCFLPFWLNAQEKEIKEKTGQQTMNSKTTKSSGLDINSAVKIVDLNAKKTYKQPAYFINGKHFTEIILKTTNPEMIDSIAVVKEEIEIEGIKYYGQVHIAMKPDYKPEFISLAELKSKYFEQRNRPAIFMIDNEIIKNKCDKSIIDEKYILKIEIQKVENIAENLAVDIVRLITKTDENIEKANEIRIRGYETKTNQK